MLLSPGEVADAIREAGHAKLAARGCVLSTSAFHRRAEVVRLVGGGARVVLREETP